MQPQSPERYWATTGTGHSSGSPCPVTPPQRCSYWLLVALTGSTGGHDSEPWRGSLQGKLPRHGGALWAFLLENWGKRRTPEPRFQARPTGGGPQTTPQRSGA